MTWTAPRTWVAGEVLTASLLNTHLRDNMLAQYAGGGLVFTTESARDAAITVPTEGMSCRLTAPTVPAQTGDNNPGLPSTIETVYHGTSPTGVWVCTTPVGARTDALGNTTNSGSWTPTLTSGGTNPSVTLVTGTTALVSLASNLFYGTTLANQYMSVAVSGATTLAASTSYGLLQGTTAGTGYGATFILTGLTGGTNVFTVQYQSTGSVQLNAGLRSLTVQGIA